MQQRWKALVVLTAARTSLGFQVQSVGSISPVLLPDLGLDYVDLGTLIGLYFLPGIALTIPAGMFGRLFGDKRVVLTGLVLMAAGAVIMGMATGFTGLAGGRLVSGIGSVLLNVLMAKMVTDWFAGSRQIVLAMAIFINSFPVGLGLALLTLGWLAETHGWPMAMFVTSGLTVISLLMVALLYRVHPNDRAQATGQAAAKGSISSYEVLMVSVAGAIWGGLNGVLAIIFGFVPSYLVAGGLPIASVGVAAGLASWLIVASGYLGGYGAQRLGNVDTAMKVCLGAISVFLLAIPLTWPMPALFLAVAAMGLTTGIIMSLPSQVLRSENRGLGMGIFFLWLYLAQTSMPPLAGWLQERTQNTAAPLYLAAAAMLSLLPLYSVFRATVIRWPQTN
ncbi:MFS transporter [Paeniroseomonas aquatica]|uniref:MFS transporter n=1 Tax=Paeniroseomonas aquatica TaxID=373043 RepID=A0ABT8A0U4_9PROT|nr:MFS transporter [Paeniroseomonas aquatica]MDN3563299.1 MFS transporter [Paeniroseomonas aquatica]